jgi:hypothetical protein
MFFIFAKLNIYYSFKFLEKFSSQIIFEIFKINQIQYLHSRFNYAKSDGPKLK